MADDLKPCPFCGGEADIWRAHADRTAWIACMGKCSVLVSKEYTTDAEAIAAWNTRAPDPRIEALERERDAAEEAHIFADAARDAAEAALATMTQERDEARAALATARADALRVPEVQALVSIVQTKACSCQPEFCAEGRGDRNCGFEARAALAAFRALIDGGRNG